MQQDLLQNIIKQVELITDQGLSIEIKDFYEGEPNVVNYGFSIEDTCYVIHIKLKCFDLAVVKKLFLSFAAFMQYSEFTFYTLETADTGDSASYHFLSGREDLKAFYCKLIFS